jgi:hypothetical protein
MFSRPSRPLKNGQQSRRKERGELWNLSQG